MLKLYWNFIFLDIGSISYFVSSEKYHFYAPEIKDQGAYCFCPSVIFYPAVWNFNPANNMLELWYFTRVFLVTRYPPPPPLKTVPGLPTFTLSHRGSDNSPLLIVFSANYIDQSNRNFMCLKVFRKFWHFDLLNLRRLHVRGDTKT